MQHSTVLTKAITAHLPSAFKSLHSCPNPQAVFSIIWMSDFSHHNTLKIIPSEKRKKKDKEGPFVGGRK